MVSFPSSASNTVVTADPADGEEFLWLFQCLDNFPLLVLIPNPKSTYPSGADLSLVFFDMEDFPPRCEVLPGPVSGAELWNVVPALSIAPLGEPVDSFRLVYPDMAMSGSAAFQIAHVVDVAVAFPSPPEVFLEGFVLAVDGPLLDASGANRHVMWPDLTWPRGFETNPLHRYHQVLTWVEVANTGLGPLVGQRTRSIVWRADLQSYFDLGIVAMSILNGNQIMPLGPTSRWFGDYKYGTFVDGAGDLARFFVPWSQTMVGDGTPSGRIFGAQVFQ